MLITITRHYSARDITRGTLTVDSHPEFELKTLEPQMPRNMSSYVGHCLPPGEYACCVEVRSIDYRGVTLHLPWITLPHVDWYPNARFVQSDVNGQPERGQIFLGSHYTRNGFMIANTDSRAMKVWARLSKIASDAGEAVVLRVCNAADLTMEDTYMDKAQREREERERMAMREELKAELLGDYGSEKVDCSAGPVLGDADQHRCLAVASQGVH